MVYVIRCRRLPKASAHARWVLRRVGRATAVVRAFQSGPNRCPHPSGSAGRRRVPERAGGSQGRDLPLALPTCYRLAVWIQLSREKEARDRFPECRGSRENRVASAWVSRKTIRPNPSVRFASGDASQDPRRLPSVRLADTTSDGGSFPFHVERQSLPDIVLETARDGVCRRFHPPHLLACSAVISRRRKITLRILLARKKKRRRLSLLGAAFQQHPGGGGVLDSRHGSTRRQPKRCGATAVRLRQV